MKKKIPLLILCNKTDKVTAHSKDFIRRQMEKEMYDFKSQFLNASHLIFDQLLYSAIFSSSYFIELEGSKAHVKLWSLYGPSHDRGIFFFQCEV